MVAVWDRLVTSARAVLVVGVVAVFGVDAIALVPMALVEVVDVAIVEVVDVIAVGDGRVAASGCVLVRVDLVDCVGDTHDVASWACRIASRTMWSTWSSTIA